MSPVNKFVNYKGADQQLFLLCIQTVWSPLLLANSEDPDEMQLKVTFHLSLHCLI